MFLYSQRNESEPRSFFKKADPRQKSTDRQGKQVKSELLEPKKDTGYKNNIKSLRSSKKQNTHYLKHWNTKEVLRNITKYKIKQMKAIKETTIKGTENGDMGHSE